MSNPNGFYFQTHEELAQEIAAAEHREHSEQAWLDSFMDEAKEVDEQLKQLKEDLK
jgi:hypothetical protein